MQRSNHKAKKKKYNTIHEEYIIFAHDTVVEVHRKRKHRGDVQAIITPSKFKQEKQNHWHSWIFQIAWTTHRQDDKVEDTFCQPWQDDHSRRSAGMVDKENDSAKEWKLRLSCPFTGAQPQPPSRCAAWLARAISRRMCGAWLQRVNGCIIYKYNGVYRW